MDYVLPNLLLARTKNQKMQVFSNFSQEDARTNTQLSRVTHVLVFQNYLFNGIFNCIEGTATKYTVTATESI